MKYVTLYWIEPGDRQPKCLIFHFRVADDSDKSMVDMEVPTAIHSFFEYSCGWVCWIEREL